MLDIADIYTVIVYATSVIIVAITCNYTYNNYF